MPAPAATGRRRPRFAPTKLAVSAASTSTASSPSRKTSSPLSSTTAPWLNGASVAVGSTTPSGEVTAFQVSAAIATPATRLQAARRSRRRRAASSSAVSQWNM